MPGLQMDHVGWCGDASYALSALALLLTVVGVCTPSWIDTTLNFEQFRADHPEFVNTFQPVEHIIGRGFFQAYEYNGYGLVTLIPYFTTDNEGKMDCFCGDGEIPTLFPSLRAISDVNLTSIGTRGRQYDRGDWCTRRDTSAAFAIMTILFGFFAMVGTFCAQHGRCGQLPFIILTFVVFVFALICCVTMGSFLSQENGRIDDTPNVDERFFPFEQETKIGYSFLCFLFGMLIFFLAAILAMIEQCRHGGKTNSSKKDRKSTSTDA
eukprot:m.87091 g.87091  ORF g.87091 m.87091 type:complete len:266 (-) comp12230_c0_seq6:1973-2770(-)